MQLDPREAYPGSSSLIKTLVYFSGATGSRQALVGFPRATRGGHLAGLLEQQGFETEVAFHSRRLFELATFQPNCEVILISDALARPAAVELIQALRSDGASG